VALQAGREDSAQSWSVEVADLHPETWDLSVKNPIRAAFFGIQEHIYSA
jgi:hypothetical protein